MSAEENWPEPIAGWPSWLWTVPYRGDCHPAALELPVIENGANCQRYAYAVLELYDVLVPAWRSSELWADDATMQRIEPAKAAALDLVLFNEGPQPYGAHVAVLMKSDQLLHLCHEVGRPAVWSWEDFLRRPRYATVVGVQRHRGLADGAVPRPFSLNAGVTSSMELPRLGWALGWGWSWDPSRRCS